MNPMDGNSEVLLHALGIPKIAGEVGIGVLPGVVIMELLYYLIVEAGYLESIVAHLKDMSKH